MSPAYMSSSLRRIGGELDAAAAGVVDIHGVARPSAVQADVFDLDALRFQLFYHGVGVPRALEFEGVVGYARPGTVLGVEQAQAGAAQLEPHYVSTRHLVTHGLLRAQHVPVEVDRRLQVFGVGVPRT